MSIYAGAPFVGETNSEYASRIQSWSTEATSGVAKTSLLILGNINYIVARDFMLFGSGW